MTFGLSGAALGGVIAGAGAIGGALISSNASGNAAATQAQSASDATAAQVGMFNTQVGLQEPWRQAGIGALDKLNSLMGLPATSGGGTPLLTQGPDGVFAPSVGPRSATPAALPAPAVDESAVQAEQQRQQMIASQAQQASQAGLSADDWRARVASGQIVIPTVESADAIRARLAGASAAAGPGAVTTVPQPGSLLTNPGAGMYAFTAADFTADPGYQFRQDQQKKALDAAAAAQGTFGSGKYLKDAMTYSGNLASQEYGNAYSRYNTDQTNQYNRTVNDQTNSFNRLSSIAGLGQTSANTLTNAAGTLGGQIGSNIIGAGNAAAAGQIGSANALNGAIGQGISMYQQNQLLSRFPVTTGYGGYSGGVTPPNPYY